MKLDKGINLNTRPEEQPDGTYAYGKNGIQYDLKGSITNEPGFKEILKAVIPLGYKHNGTIETDTNKVLIFFTNNIYSCMKLVDVDTGIVSFNFTDASHSYKLGFNTDFYIVGTMQRNYLGELVVAFTDKNTFPKFQNLDKPEIGSLKNWNLFPECNHAILTKTLSSGGYIKVGSYFVASRYYKQDGTVTSFSAISSGIVVTSPDNEPVSDKLVQIEISGMDTAYDFIELAIISKAQGVTSAILLKKLPVTSGTITTAYTGNETYDVISLEEILVPLPSYDKASTITQLNDALYIAKLEKTNIVVDMQPYASLIKILWVSELQEPLTPSDEVQDGRKKGFMHGETYAFYARYKLANGGYSVAFIIPGVYATIPDMQISTVGTAGGLLNALVYEVEDTIVTFDPLNFTGACGTYINKTEIYPGTDDFNSFPVGGTDNRNSPVRHHKMPSLKWCKENLYSTETDYGTKKLDLLGIQALNVIIPPKYQDIIVGYEILYAKRTIQNATQYGQGLLLYGAYSSYANGAVADPVNVYSTGHNWQVNGTVNTGFRPLQTYIRFHAFDVLFNRPGIKPAFIAAQYKLKGNIDTRYVSWSYPAGGSPQDSYGNSCTLVDMTGGVASNSIANYVNGIESSKYILHNTNTNEYINQYLESCLAAKLLGAALPLNVSSNDQGYSGVFSGDLKVESHLISLNDIKENIYDSFYTQELVSAGDAINLGTVKVFWGGDVFVNPYTFHTYGVADKNWASHFDNGTNIADPEYRGRRIVHRLICETVANQYSRYEEPGNSYSKWYDHNPLPILGATINWASVYPVPYNGMIDPNQFGYSKGAEGINDFLPDDIFNPYREYLTKFPYRIHRGGKLSRQNQRSWRTFLALDYYECQKNMGFIEHIEGMEDRLLIHHTNALFMTQDKTKLEAGLLSVTLGTGDIFQFEPQEVQSSKLGYAGTQHDLACIRTPLGYVFPDAKQGEMYIVKGKELKLLNDGLHRFLREYLKIMGTNPYTGNGITIGWDQKYKRILATIKNQRPIGNPEVKVLFTADILDVAVGGPPSLFTTQGTVQVGETIYLNGRYVVYQGLNDLAPEYDCPPDIIPCDPVTGLHYTFSDPPLGNHVYWDDMGAGSVYLWVLYELVNGNLIQLLTASTTFTFVDFDATQISKDTIYFFEVFKDCGEGVFSTGTATIFSLASPPPIVLPPGPLVGIWVLPRGLAQLHLLGIGGCGGTNLSNVSSIEITVDGIYQGATGVGGASGCVLSGGIWTHFPDTTTGGLSVSAPGPLTAATLELKCLDNIGNPANMGGQVPGGLLKTDLTLTNAVVSGSNNHIFTYTNVHMNPNIPFINNNYIIYLYVNF